MIDKQNPRPHALAYAVLIAALGVSGAHAAEPKLLVKEPARAVTAGAEAASRIVVRYRDGSAAAASATGKLSAAQAAVARAGVSVAATGRAAALAPKASYVRRLGVGADLIKLSGKLDRAQLDKVVAELAADPAVEYAVVDTKLRHTEIRPATDATAQLVPNDPYYANYQWHYSNATGGINAPAAWDISQGEGVVVAVLDTGILYDHPDFAGTQVLQGYDFISDAETSRRATDARVPGALDYGDWVENDNECYDGSVADDSSWHGTHVAGTVAETTNNGIGMASVAHKATVLPVRVLGKCGGYLSDITDAITWASGGHVDGVPDNTTPAEVINMSLGGGSPCDALYQSAINGAVARGTTVVVAAGNSAGNAANFRPASCDNVIAVGATRITGGIAYYSNYGLKVDLAAPGGGGSVDGNPGGFVWQAGYSGATTPSSGSYTYMGLGGTSMASPHVAATVALVQSAVVAAGGAPLTPAAVETLLKQTARPFPVTIPAATPIGSGILDAKAALDKALEKPCDPGVESCAPSATPLTNKVVVGGLAGAAGSEALYSFKADAGKVLSVQTYGGTGNVSLYVGFEAEPSASRYDGKSTRAGNSETVRFTAPQAGTYYIKVVGEAAYAGVSLVARQ